MGDRDAASLHPPSAQLADEPASLLIAGNPHIRLNMKLYSRMDLPKFDSNYPQSVADEKVEYNRC